MEYYEAKFFCQNILEKEIKNLNLEIKPFIFGRLSYFNEKHFKDEFKYNLMIIDDLYNYSLKEKINSFINVLKILSFPVQANGVYRNQKKSLIVFANDIGHPILKNNIVQLLKTTYHELYHAIYFNTKQKGFKFNDFNSFACDLEQFLMKHNIGTPLRYLYNHDSFMFEILANIYGVKKTEEYISQNPNAHNYDLKKLKKIKQKYDRQYDNYNLSKILDDIIKNYKSALKCKDFDKSFFEIFLNEDGTFKNLNSSFLNEKINQIDKRIIDAFLNTNSFLKEAKIQGLNNSIYYLKQNFIEIKEGTKKR